MTSTSDARDESSEDAGSRTQGGLGGLVRHSAIYSAAPALRQVISVSMHRLYTGWLGTAGIGVKEIVDFWLIALQQILGYNALSGMMRFYFERKSPEDRAKVVTSCTLLVTLVAWTVCGALLSFSDGLVEPMLGRGEQVPTSELSRILQLALLLVPFQLASCSGFYYLMILKRSGLYTSIQTGKLFFEIALNFWLIGALDMGVRGFLTSMLVSEALTATCFVLWMMVTLKPRISLEILRPILAYASPLIAVGFFQLALHQVDRRLLLHFGEEGHAQSMTGIYGHGYKISYLVTAMVLSPFMQIWHPWIYGVEDPARRSRLVARVSTYCVLAIAASSLAVIAAGRQGAILLAGDPEFWQAYRVIPLVTGGYVFWSLYHVSQMPLFLAKRTGRLMLINGIALGINVALNAYLIPRFGFVGAGVATFLTFGCLAGLGMLASRSEADVPFEVGRLAVILGCVVVGGALSLTIDRFDELGRISIVVAIAAKLGVLALLLGVLWRVLDAQERGDVTRWIQARRAARGASGGGGGR